MRYLFALFGFLCWGGSLLIGIPAVALGGPFKEPYADYTALWVETFAENVPIRMTFFLVGFWYSFTVGGLKEILLTFIAYYAMLNSILFSGLN